MLLLQYTQFNIKLILVYYYTVGQTKASFELKSIYYIDHFHNSSAKYIVFLNWSKPINTVCK